MNTGNPPSSHTRNQSGPGNRLPEPPSAATSSEPLVAPRQIESPAAPRSAAIQERRRSLQDHDLLLTAGIDNSTKRIPRQKLLEILERWMRGGVLHPTDVIGRGLIQTQPNDVSRQSNVTITRSSKRNLTKTSGRVILSPVMSYDTPGQLTVPCHLNLGNDGKLYLTRAGEPENPKTKPRSTSLKESVAWFRLGHDCNVNLTKGTRFNEWLKLIEQALT